MKKFLIAVAFVIALPLVTAGTCNSRDVCVEKSTSATMTKPICKQSPKPDPVWVPGSSPTAK